MIKEIWQIYDNSIILYYTEDDSRERIFNTDKSILIQEYYKTDIVSIIDNIKYLFNVSAIYKKYAFYILRQNSNIQVYRLLL